MHPSFSIIQTLHVPWGFGLDYEASEAELIGRCRDMHMHISEGRVHFFDILKGNPNLTLP